MEREPQKLAPRGCSTSPTRFALREWREQRPADDARRERKRELTGQRREARGGGRSSRPRRAGAGARAPVGGRGGWLRERGKWPAAAGRLGDEACSRGYWIERVERTGQTGQQRRRGRRRRQRTAEQQRSGVRARR